MKRSLLKYLVCPMCQSALELHEPSTGAARMETDPEIIEGALQCRTCQARFSVSQGVPRMHELATQDDTRARTSASFGYLWARSVPGDEVYDTRDYHFAKMQ